MGSTDIVLVMGAIGLLLSTLAAIITGAIMSKRAARKEDVLDLRAQLVKATTAIDDWRYGYARLFSHDLTCQRLLSKVGIVPPDMPNFNFMKEDVPSEYNPYAPFPNGVNGGEVVPPAIIPTVDAGR